MCLCRKKKNTHSTNLWIPLLLFSIVLHGTASGSETAGSRRAPADDTVDSLQRFSRSISETILHGNASESEIPRDRRAPADDVIENLQRLSRIASGIALELGLSDKSLDSDGAVAELLHIGSLKLQNVLDLDMTSIDKALKTLESLPTPTDDVKKVEDRLIELDKVRRTSGFMANFATFPGRKEYGEGLKLIEGLKSLDVTKLPKLKSDAETLGNQLNAYKLLPEELSEIQVKEVGQNSKFDAFKLEQMEQAVKLLDPIVTTLKAALAIKEHANFLEILYKEKTIRDQIPQFFYPATVEDVDSNMKKVGEAQKDLQPVKSSFETLQSLTSSRTIKFDPTNKFTSGFPSGSSDLEHLADDVESSWVKERIGDSKTVIENLHQAFKPYEDVAVKMKDVEKTWNRDLRESQLLGVLETYSSAFAVPGDTKPLLGTMKKLKEIDEVRMNPASQVSSIDPIKLKIDDLNLKLSQLSTLEYSKDLKNLTPLKTILTTTATVDKALATKMVSELKALPDLHSTINTLDKLESDIEALITLTPKVSSLAQEITNEFQNSINLYHKGVNMQPYIQFFTDLHAIGEKTAGVKEAVVALQKSRPAPDAIPTSKSTINSILKSKSNVEQVKTSVATLGDVGVSFQSTFNDYAKFTQALGNGVQGLLAIQTAFKSKSDLTPLLENLEVILKASNGLVKEHQESLRKLNGLVNTFKEIDNFQLALAKYQASRKKRDADFKSFETVFDEAAKIPDFKEDIKPIQEAMEALNQATKNKFADTKSALDKLDTLDLEFAKFKIGEAKGSLQAMDSFFVEYTKKLKAVPPAQPPPKSPSAPKGPTAASNSIKTSTESTEPDFLNVMLDFFKSTTGMIVLAGILVATAIGGFFAVRHFCCNRRKKDDDDDDLPDSIVTGSTVTTPVSTATPATEDPKNPKNPKDPKDDKDGPSGAGPSGSNDGQTASSAAPSTSNEVSKEAPKRTSKGNSKGNSKEAPKEKPSKSGSKESNMGMVYDKTQDKTKTETVDVLKTEDASSTRSNLKAPSGTPTPHPKMALPGPSKNQNALGKPKKKGNSKGSASKNSRIDDRNMATAEEQEVLKQQPEVEGEEDTPNSLLEDPVIFSLLKDTLKGIYDGHEKHQPPNHFLGMMCTIKADYANYTGHEKLNQDGRRSLEYPCRELFRFPLLGFDDPFFNCNYKQFGSIKWWMADAPSNGKESVRGPTGKFRTLGYTLNKQIAFVFQARIRVILKLCDWLEKNKKYCHPYHTDCAQYYSEVVGESLKFGRYEVMTVGKGTEEDYRKFTNREQFAIYELVIRDILAVEGQTESIHVTVVSFSGWKNDITPKEPQSGVDMIKFADGFGAPVLVHCIDGVTRTGALVAVKCGIFRAKNGQASNIAQIVSGIRSSRFGVVTRAMQVSYIVLCVTKAMMDEFEIKYMDEYWAMYYYHQQMCKGAYNRCPGFTPGDLCAQNEMAMFKSKDEDAKRELIKQKKVEYLAEENKRKKVEGAAKETEQKSKKVQSRKSKRVKGSKDKV